MQVRFCRRQACSLFLRAYREGALRAALQRCLAAALSRSAGPLQLELRAGAERLDALLSDEERCLGCILAQKVRLGGPGLGGAPAAEAPTHVTLPSPAGPAPG